MCLVRCHCVPRFLVTTDLTVAHKSRWDPHSDPPPCGSLKEKPQKRYIGERRNLITSQCLSLFFDCPDFCLKNLEVEFQIYPFLVLWRLELALVNDSRFEHPVLGKEIFECVEATEFVMHHLEMHLTRKSLRLDSLTTLRELNQFSSPLLQPFCSKKISSKLFVCDMSSSMIVEINDPSVPNAAQVSTITIHILAGTHSYISNRFKCATLPIQRSKPKLFRLYIASRLRISTSSKSEMLEANKLRKPCCFSLALIEPLVRRWMVGGMSSGVPNGLWGRRVISVSVYYSSGNTLSGALLYTLKYICLFVKFLWVRPTCTTVSRKEETRPVCILKELGASSSPI